MKWRKGFVTFDTYIYVYIYIYICIQCATRVKPPPCQELRIGAVNWNSVVLISSNIKHAMWHKVGNYVKKKIENLWKSFNIWSKIVLNSWKIDLQSRLGALSAPAWRQDGPRATTRANFDEKYSILGWPVGSKMEPKSIKNLIKNRLDFCNDFETFFSRY